METFTCIKHHLTTLNADDIFTSRQMLKFGPRKYVDLALSRLVREKKIKRLSFGVFCLIQENEVSPTVHDVVAKKKGGNRVVLAELITDPVAPDCKLIYLTDGYSGSFLCNGTRVILKKICDRKRQLSKSYIGRIFLALWLTGRKNVDAKLVHNSLIRLSAEDKSKLRNYLPLLPAWLSNYLIVELKQLGL